MGIPAIGKIIGSFEQLAISHTLTLIRAKFGYVNNRRGQRNICWVVVIASILPPPSSPPSSLLSPSLPVLLAVAELALVEVGRETALSFISLWWLNVNGMFTEYTPDARIRTRVHILVIPRITIPPASSLKADLESICHSY